MGEGNNRGGPTDNVNIYKPGGGGPNKSGEGSKKFLGQKW